jgi:hypothetical protein
MANLRPDETNLPFVVWVSQKAGAQHDIRVKVAPGPKVIASQMGVYAVRPFRYVARQPLSSQEEKLLESWILKNLDVLIGFWDGDIEYTRDMMEKIEPL